MHLVDSHLCADAGKFLAAALLTLTAMLHLALPHVSALSKVDLLESYGALPFDLEFYARGGEAEHLAAAVLADSMPSGGDAPTPAQRRRAKLSRGLCELLDDYGLVNFVTLDVQDEASMRTLLALIDKANGAVFAGLARAAAARGEPSLPHLYTATARAEDWPSERLMAVTERHMPSRDAD